LPSSVFLRKTPAQDKTNTSNVKRLEQSIDWFDPYVILIVTRLALGISAPGTGDPKTWKLEHVELFQLQDRQSTIVGCM
jgi:hypothetical protein